MDVCKGKWKYQITIVFTFKNGNGDKSSSPPREDSFGRDELLLVPNARSQVY